MTPNQLRELEKEIKQPGSHIDSGLAEKVLLVIDRVRELEKSLLKMCMKVNPVTSAHRHGLRINTGVSNHLLTSLCDYQIKCEELLKGNR